MNVLGLFGDGQAQAELLKDCKDALNEALEEIKALKLRERVDTELDKVVAVEHERIIAEQRGEIRELRQKLAGIEWEHGRDLLTVDKEMQKQLREVRQRAEEEVREAHAECDKKVEAAEQKAKEAHAECDKKVEAAEQKAKEEVSEMKAEYQKKVEAGVNLATQNIKKYNQKLDVSGAMLGKAIEEAMRQKRVNNELSGDIVKLRTLVQADLASTLTVMEAHIDDFHKGVQSAHGELLVKPV